MILDEYDSFIYSATPPPDRLRSHLYKQKPGILISQSCIDASTQVSLTENQYQTLLQYV